MRITLLIVLLLVSQPLATTLSINSSGIAEAHLRVAASEGLNEIKLPVEPIPETIEIAVDNSSLIPLYENGTLYFFSPISGEAEISYLVNISLSGRLFRFHVNGSQLIELLLAPEIVLLSVPERIENFSYVGNQLLIQFYGPEEIEYSIKQKAATPASIQKTATSFTATSKAGQRLLYEDYGLMIFAAGLAISAVIIAAILYRSRRTQTPLERGLSDIDLSILEAVRSSGGSILQGRLQTELGLPKTTLWRHVKKLEKMGYIRVVKEGTFNRLLLAKDIG